MGNNRGVTLTELIIVVAIIGILAAIAIPAYIGQQTRAARTEGFSNLESLRLLEEQFFSERGGYAPVGGGNINYNATPGVNDGGIEDILPGFHPGGCTACAAPFGLFFTYTINGVDADGNGLAESFVATATGAGGRIPATEVYTIDQNNNKNF